MVIMGLQGPNEAAQRGAAPMEIERETGSKQICGYPTKDRYVLPCCLHQCLCPRSSNEAMRRGDLCGSCFMHIGANLFWPLGGCYRNERIVGCSTGENWYYCGSINKGSEVGQVKTCGCPAKYPYVLPCCLHEFLCPKSSSESRKEGCQSYFLMQLICFPFVNACWPIGCCEQGGDIDFLASKHHCCCWEYR